MTAESTTSFAERERLALADLPPDDPLVLAEHRRLVEAVEQVHRSAGLLGLEPTEAYAPLAVRCDAWLYRVDRGRQEWQAILASPLFAGPWEVAA